MVLRALFDEGEVDVTAQRRHRKPHSRSSRLGLFVLPLNDILRGRADSTGQHAQASIPFVLGDGESLA